MTEKLSPSNQELLPEDSFTQTPDLQLTIPKQDQLQLDPTLSEQVGHYAGRERRTYLDQQVEVMYNRVIKELNYFPADAALALKKLSRAHGLVLEEPDQYNAALNEVAEVKMMIIEKQMRRQWAYTWGLMLFFYALICFVGLAVGFFFDINGLTQGAIYIAEGYTPMWYMTLAGGMGGVVAILVGLAEQISQNQFDRQDVMTYLVQPVTGLILGLLMFFIANTGFLIFGSTVLGAERATFTSPQIFLIVLAWIAGFRQVDIYTIIDQMLARVLPKQKI